MNPTKIQFMTNMTVANTILQQLGGGRFIAMTGSKDFVGDSNSLRFKVGRNSAGVNLVKVILDADDTYRMEFCRFRKNTVTILTVKTNVYFDQLQAIFTDQTGLYTSL